jgi:hypothetical protein
VAVFAFRDLGEDWKRGLVQCNLPSSKSRPRLIKRGLPNNDGVILSDEQLDYNETLAPAVARSTAVVMASAFPARANVMRVSLARRVRSLVALVRVRGS